MPAEIWFLNEHFVVNLSKYYHYLPHYLSADLFMNPLTQEYNYRAYIIDNIKSLELLDQKSMYSYVDFYVNKKISKGFIKHKTSRRLPGDD